MIIILMGAMCSGKTTTGETLAKHFPLSTYRDADSFHPRENVEKMEKGISLTDQDREPWLSEIARFARNHHDESSAQPEQPVIVSCSALKKKYRETLRTQIKKPVYFVFLDVSQSELERRAQSRRGHFMPPSLLKSQLETLERPSLDEDDVTSIEVDGPQSPEEVVAAIFTKIPDLTKQEK